MTRFGHKEQLQFDPEIEKTVCGLRKASKQRQQQEFKGNSSFVEGISIDSREYLAVKKTMENDNRTLRQSAAPPLNQ